jgi:hypothetical protein
MRILEITGECQFRLCEDSEEAAVPEYAILSHTWGLDDTEVTLKDVIEDVVNLECRAKTKKCVNTKYCVETK